jgi:sec-independent protein translocase protein TatA
MGSLSIWHWLLVIGIAVLLFGGKGKISSVMGDFAKGIKAFKSGMKEPEEEAAANPPAQVTPPGTSTAAATSSAGATASPAPVGAGAGVGVGDRPRDRI